MAAAAPRSPAAGSFMSLRSSGETRTRRFVRRLIPCFDRQRQVLEEEELSIQGGFASFASCGGESWATAPGASPSADVQHALASIRRGLQLLEGLDSLSLEGDIGRAQVKEGLRRLEASVPEPVQPTSVQAASSSRQPASPSSFSGKTPRSLRWQNAVSAAMVQQALAATDGALAPALSALVAALWPRINTYVCELVHTDIEPMINSSLPGMFQGSVKFTKVSLGASSPSFGPLYVDHRPESGEIEINVGIKFASDLDMELTAMGVPVGITQISLEGVLVCLLSPPTAKPPFFGGIQVFFPNPPEVGISFVGAARVADIPGLRGAVRGAVAGGIAGVCVLPRRIAVDMDEEDSVDITDLSYPEPTGVLRFTLLSGADLAAADVSLFGSATSDPYVVATLGCKTWTSPTVRKTLNPVWGSEGVVADFPVHSERQALALKVYDYDFGTSDDLIGVAQPISASKLASSGSTASIHEVPLSSGSGEPGAGKLRFLAEVLGLTADRGKARMQGPSVAQLSAKVLHASGLDASAEYPFKVRIRVLSAEEVAGGLPASELSRELSTGSRSRPLLKSSRSAQLGTAPRREVLAEGLTAASTPHPETHLAEVLQSACAALSAQGKAAEEIARILDVDAQQVEAFLASRGDAATAERVAREAAAKRAAARPCFGEVVQMLLPAVEEFGFLELSLLDKRQRPVGSLELPVHRLLAAEGARLPGPFELAPADGVSCAGAGLTLEGSLWLRWLA